MLLSAPSKTFLIGEYGALTGGPALLLNTTPRFELRTQKLGSDRSSVTSPKADIFHSESPAGRLQAEVASRIPKVEFLDPHAGQGGFGASSAQFLFIWALANQKKSVLPSEASLLLRDYQSYSKNRGRAPSGYDVVAQSLGGITFIQSETQKFQVERWPFEDLSFLLIRTGQKVATHTHLGELGDLEFRKLAEISGQTIAEFRSGCSEAFVEGVARFQANLVEMGLTLPSTLDLLRQLKGETGVRTAKACGALGADVVVALVDRSERDRLRQMWSAIADERDVTGGLSVKNLEPDATRAEARIL